MLRCFDFSSDHRLLPSLPKKTVEVPRIGGHPRGHAQTGSKIQKTVEIPQAQFPDKVVGMPVATQHQPVAMHGQVSTFSVIKTGASWKPGKDRK